MVSVAKLEGAGMEAGTSEASRESTGAFDGKGVN